MFFCVPADPVFVEQVHILQSGVLSGVLEPLLQPVMKIQIRINDVGIRQRTLNDLSGIVSEIFAVFLAHAKLCYGAFMLENGLFLLFQTLADNAVKAFRGIFGAMFIPEILTLTRSLMQTVIQILTHFLTLILNLIQTVILRLKHLLMQTRN